MFNSLSEDFEMKKNFLLCLGNQKCGTSWLYQYLMNQENFNGGFLKEYHIWDALDIPILSRNKIIKYENKSQKLRYRMQTEQNFYFEYFDSLYSDLINLTADITPSYSGLTKKRLEVIKTSFESKEIEVKVIILIREPLNRIKSAVRFNLDRKNFAEGIKQGVSDFTTALEQYYTNEHCKIRTNYDLIINKAYEVFAKENIYVGIYENMFFPAQINELSKFLDIKFDSDFGKVLVNKTRNKVSNTLIDKDITLFYSNVYAFCFNKFPITQELWQ